MTAVRHLEVRYAAVVIRLVMMHDDPERDREQHRQEPREEPAGRVVSVDHPSRVPDGWSHVNKPGVAGADLRRLAGRLPSLGLHGQSLRSPGSGSRPCVGGGRTPHA